MDDKESPPSQAIAKWSPGDVTSDARPRFNASFSLNKPKHGPMLCEQRPENPY
jgi:hypothetical protein